MAFSEYMNFKKILSIKTALVLKSPLNRPNLFYEVRQKEDGNEYLEKLLTQEFKGQSGIIYTLTIKDVETLTNHLRSRGIKVSTRAIQFIPFGSISQCPRTDSNKRFK